jgi:phage-related holin
MEFKPENYEILYKYASEIKAVIYTTFVFLNIDVDIVKILMLLMLLDTIFGIWKAIVLSKKVRFKILYFGLTTKTLILLIPMTLALVGKGLKTYDFTPLVDITLKILVVSEGFSVFTSMYVIKTKKEVENIDLISMLLSAIRKGLLNLIKVWLGKIENPKND